MPNLFAYGMIILWPIIAILLYKKFDTITATFWVVVGGFMFLPDKTIFDLPIFLIGKEEISGISALLCCIFIKNEKIYFLGRGDLQKYLIIFVISIPIFNVFFNQKPMFNGQIWIQGLSVYDAIVAMCNQYVRLLPFIVGVSICHKKGSFEKFLKLIVIAGLVYSILFVIELKFSPQLHTWIYGFFPHSFVQTIRYGGVRPVIFMGHGLLVATFYMVCLCASAIELKNAENKMKALGVFCFFGVVLLSTKTVGAFIFGLFLSIMILFTTIRIQKLCSSVLLGIFLIYPTLSILNLIPYDTIIDFVKSIDTNRADSIGVRFDNERMLLDHIRERFFIGWGGMARNRFFNTISDGYWLIIFGYYGFVYFFAYFMLFGLGVFAKINSNHDKKFTQLKVNMSLLITILLIDQIPNSSLNHGWLWLIAGCFYSFVNFSSDQNEKLADSKI